MVGTELTKKEMRRIAKFHKYKLMINDLFMHELDLDIDENDHLFMYDKDDSAILINVGGKFLKYDKDDVYPVVTGNEIDFNLLENSSIAESIAMLWLNTNVENKIVSLEQNVVPGNAAKGKFTIIYEKGNSVASISSDIFMNESVRILNCICKIKGTDESYDFSEYDVCMPKKEKK